MAGIELLSDITVFSKYAKFLEDEQRREIWPEIVDRNKKMHCDKFKDLSSKIEEIYKPVYTKKVLPSMRSFQFGGKPIEVNNTRMYNCSFLPMSEWQAFHELMFLLLGGTGVGYSVQKHHVKQLPPVLGTNGKVKKHIVADSIIGWADTIKVLMKAYFFNRPLPRFDYADVRPKGAPIKTAGGKAPGPQPLKDAVHNIQKILNAAISTRGVKTQLTPIEVHDINCYIADAVLSGGIRRSAMISLFSFDDSEMLGCKFGDWYINNPQRAKANNSVVLVRDKAKEKHFNYIWERVKESGAGEPGIFWTNDKNIGTNPCAEISLKPYQFCNLTEINVGDITSQEDLNYRAYCGGAIGTLQASYTDFHYLRDIWKETTEKDALIGVSMTGIASGKVLHYDLPQAANAVKIANQEWAQKLGINESARLTTIKPSGTASCVLGTSSGIHAWYAPYYIRRLRFAKDEAIYSYLKRATPHLIEDCFFNPDKMSVMSIPIKAPENAIYRGEHPIDLLNRVKYFKNKWVNMGHIMGKNTNNVSVTVSIKPDQWDEVGQWMWENWEEYNGIAVIPYDGGSYVQTPFEEISEEKYNEMLPYCRNIDLRKVKEEEDNTEIKQEIACVGGACEIN